jgi:hypothetical protein
VLPCNKNVLQGEVPKFRQSKVTFAKAPATKITFAWATVIKGSLMLMAVIFDEAALTSTYRKELHKPMKHWTRPPDNEPIRHYNRL